MIQDTSLARPAAPVVGPFATCLANALRPAVGLAAVSLLERAGGRVEVPPSLISGGRQGTRQIARRNIEKPEANGPVVVTSGSCTAAFMVHYPELSGHDPAWLARVQSPAKRTHERLGYLRNVRGWPPAGMNSAGRATCHDRCRGLHAVRVG